MLTIVIGFLGLVVLICTASNGEWGAFGLALVVLVKSLLKTPLLTLCGGHDVAHLIRYFLMVLVAGAVWPRTFRFYEKYAK